MNERTLIGQSAMVYCASKLMEACLLNCDIKAIDHKFFFMVYRLRNHAGCWKNTRRIRKSRTDDLRLEFL